MSSVESQKGIIAAQRCSVENQKGRYRYTKSMAIAPYWLSAIDVLVANTDLIVFTSTF